MPSFFSRKSSRNAKDLFDNDFESVYSYDIKDEMRHVPQDNNSDTTHSTTSSPSSTQLTPEQIAKYNKMAMRNSIRIC